MKISLLKENVINEINLVIIDSAIKKTKKGDDYAKIIFSDGDENIVSFIWNIDINNFKYKVNEVYTVFCYLQEFNSKPILKVLEMKKIEDPDIISSFIKSAIIPVSDIKTFIQKKISEIKSKDIRKLTSNIVEKYEDEYFYAPAAANNHHAYISGMSYHVYNMLQVADLFDETKVNLDILYSVIILHDIGKCFELEHGASVVYTTSGKLLGHISIGYEIVYIYALENNLLTNDIEKILHAILSHHGKIEYGSFEVPKNNEATIVNLIDTIDAYLNSFIENLEKLQLNCWSERIFALNNRKILSHDLLSTNEKKFTDDLSKKFVNIYKKRYNNINVDIIYFAILCYGDDPIQSLKNVFKNKSLINDDRLEELVKHTLLSCGTKEGIFPIYSQVIEAEIFKYIQVIKKFEYESD